MSDAYGYSPGPPSAQWQDITNTVPIPDRWTKGAINVAVRVEWARDGEERIDGVATRWTRDVVYVEFADPRKATTGIWVVAADVRRVSPSGQ
jgi:hypothetical protein